MEKISIMCKLFKNVTYYCKLELLFVCLFCFSLGNLQPHHNVPKIIYPLEYFRLILDEVFTISKSKSSSNSTFPNFPNFHEKEKAKEDGGPPNVTENQSITEKDNAKMRSQIMLRFYGSRKI